MKKISKKKALIIGAISLVLVVAILLIILLPNCAPAPEEDNEEKPIISVEVTDKPFITAGATNYVIVQPQEPSKYEEYAVEELVKYYAMATGVTIPVKSDENYTFDQTASVVSVGNTTIFQDSGVELDLAVLGDEGYRIQTIENTIVINGGGGYGTLFGVYEFMKHTIGFEAYAPDEIAYISSNTVPLYNFEVKDFPSVTNRAGGYYVAASDTRFSAKWRVLAGVGESIFDGSIWGTWAHCIYAYIDPEVYFDTYPEYYAREIDKNGNEKSITRNGEPTQICFSSIEGGAADIVVESMKQKILDMPDKKLFMIGQNDVEGFCKCTKCLECEEKYKTVAGSMMLFTNYVAREIKEWQIEEEIDRDIMICSFAYNLTEPAPVIKDTKGNNNPNDDVYTAIDEKIIAEDNVMIMIAPASADYSKDLLDTTYNSFYADVLKGWSAICDNFAIWSYSNYFFQQFEYYDNIDYLSTNIKNWHDMGAMFYLNESGGGSRGSQAFQIMNGWLNSKLGWNPEQNVDDLIDSFITNYYKEAAPYVSDYFYGLRAYYKERKEWALTNDPFKAHIPQLMWTPTKGEKTPYVKEFWKKSFLDQQWEILEEGIQAIKDAGYNEADELLYTERVLMETFTVRYQLLSYFESDYTPTEYARMVDAFEEDVIYMGVTSDGYDAMSDTIAKWRA